MKTGNPIIDGINALIAKHPHCGLSWYGVEYNAGPLWWLDGITPVGASSAIDVLRRCGENTGKIALLYRAKERRKDTAWNKKQRLIESAKKKLTPAEIAACGL